MTHITLVLTLFVLTPLALLAPHLTETADNMSARNQTRTAILAAQ